VNAMKPGPVLVGQPFTITAWIIPVTCHLTCNCQVQNGSGTGTPLQIEAGKPVQCPQCQSIYTAGFNPQTGQIRVGMGKPQQETLQ
jgi:hypothetical protein